MAERTNSAKVTLKDRFDNETPVSITDISSGGESLKRHEFYYIISRFFSDINLDIQKHNEGLAEGEKADPYVMVLKQKKFASEFTENYSKRVRASRRIPDADFNNDPIYAQTLREMMSNYGIHDFSPEDISAGIKRYDMEYRTFAGVGKVIFPDEASNYVIPLSPLEPALRNKEVFIAHGGQILFADPSVMNGSESKIDEELSAVGIAEDNGFKGFSDPETGKFTRPAFVKAGMYSEPGDKYGISFLTPYMGSAAERNSVLDGFSGLTENDYYVSQQAIEKAKNILNFLNDKGYNFTIERDTKKGEVKAVIADSPYSIRILDACNFTKEKVLDRSGKEIEVRRNVMNYVGRVFDRRTEDSYYIGKEITNKNDNLIYSDQNLKNLELVPLCYALGIDPPAILNNSESRTFDEMISAPLEPNAKSLNSYLPSDMRRVTIGLGSVTTKVKNRDKKESYRLTIAKSSPRVEKEARLAKINDLNKDTPPEEYVRRAISTAITNFETELGVENLIAAHKIMVESGDTELYFPFSSREVIGDTQATYQQILDGKITSVMKPGVMLGEEENKPENYLEIGKDGIETPEDLVRMHSELLTGAYIGTYNPSPIDHKTFAIMPVIEFMDSDHTSIYDREDEFVKKLGYCNIDPNSFRLINSDTSYLNQTMLNRSVHFEESESVSLKAKADEMANKESGSSLVFKSAYDALVKAVSSVPGYYLEKDLLNDPGNCPIRIDNNGVIRYEIFRTTTGTKVPAESMESMIATYKKQEADGTLNIEESPIVKVTGYVGQIFDYNQAALERGHKVVTTGFIGEGDSNYSFIPNAIMNILPQGEAENKTLYERAVVKNYERQISEMVMSTVKNDLIHTPGKTVQEIGKTFSVNTLYYNTTGEHLPADYFRAMIDRGMSEEDADIIMKTRSAEVVLDSTIRDNANLHSAHNASISALSRGLDNDDIHTTLAKCDNHNMAIIPTEAAGFFDRSFTGNAANQGIHLYLVQGASIGEDGHIIPARNEDGTIDTEARCILRSHDPFKHSDYNANDRNIMAAQNFLSAQSVAHHVGFMMMACAGYGYDDGFIISKEYAESNPVVTLKKEDGVYQRGEEGYQRESRPRIIGDKMSDFSGNKGVIAMIVDRNKPSSPEMIEEAKKKLNEITAEYDKAQEELREKIKNHDFTTVENLEKAMQDIIGSYNTVSDKEFSESIDPFKEDLKKIEALDSKMLSAAKRVAELEMILHFKNNPNLDVVLSSYSPTSRQNGGTAMDGMEEPFEITFNDGTKAIAGGYTNFNNLPQTADNKSHIYGEEGTGRKASPQLAWGLTSQNATEVMKELYGSNIGAYKDLKEMFNVLGGDLDNIGRIHNDYDDMFSARSSARNLFRVPDFQDFEPSGAYTKASREVTDTIERYCTDFNRQIESGGGFMVLPFSLKLANEKETPELNVTAERIEGSWLKEEKDLNNSPGFLLPIMSPHNRSGVKLYDDTKKVHEYTDLYYRIYKSSLEYNNWKAQLAKGETWDGIKLEDGKFGARKTSIPEKMEESRRNAQEAYNRLVGKIQEDYFQGKHNDIKESLMTNRVPLSATMVWSNDPYMPINEVMMSEKNALALGLGKMVKDDLGHSKFKLDNDAHVIVWRDPILHDANMRYCKVTVDKRFNQEGLRINGAMDKSFDGDFDGDTVAVVPLKTRKAKMEAKEKLSQENNLLDIGAGQDENGEYPLFVNDGMDLAAGEKVDPKLKELRAKIQTEVNELYQNVNKYKNNLKTYKDVNKVLAEYVEKIEATIKAYDAAKADPSAENNEALKASKKEIIDFLNEPLSGNPNSYYITKLYEVHISKNIKSMPLITDTSYNALKAKLGIAKILHERNSESVASSKKKLDVAKLEYDAKIPLLKTQLDRYTSHAFLNSFCQHTVSFENVDSLVKSIINHMNDGAKAGGKPDKALDFVKALGCELVAPDGTVISNEHGNAKDLLIEGTKQISTDFKVKAIGKDLTEEPLLSKQIEKSGLGENERINQQIATNAKSLLTGIAGAVSQKGVAALRDKCIEDVLNVTYMVTQAVLQLKHDPKEAVKVVGLLNDVNRDLWNGCKIHKVDENGREIPLKDVANVRGTWETVRVENKNKNKSQPQSPFPAYTTVKNLSPAEFVNLFYAFYTDKDGMNVNVNRKHVENIAKGLTLTVGKEKVIMGLNNKECYNSMEIIDKLAYRYASTYGNAINILATHDGENLYGTKNSKFRAMMPESLKKNLKLQADERKEISQRDNFQNSPEKHKESLVQVAKVKKTPQGMTM